MALAVGVVATSLPQPSSVRTVEVEKAAVSTSFGVDPVSVWWPADGITFTGVQPFKAVVNDRFVTDYRMYWSVDGGISNLMGDSYEDWPHKESRVDVSNWKWRGAGPYEVKFTAVDLGGSQIASETKRIYVGAAKATTTSSPTTSTTGTTSAPATTSTGTSATTTTAPKTTTVAPTTSSTTTSTAPKTSTTTTTAPTTATVPVTAPTRLSAVPTDSVNSDLGKFYVEASNPAAKQASEWRASRPADAREMDEIAMQPVARWFGGWNGDIAGDVNGLVSASSSQGKTAVMVAYNIPQRDCGGYSSGGTSDYKSWIRSFASGIKNRSSVVILEPDSLAQMTCLSSSDQANRKALLSDAVTVLKSAGARVYLDAGHASWIQVADMAERLRGSGIDKADGFSLNVSNFTTTADNEAFGRQLSTQVGGKRFVLDTSRNGNGAPTNGEWCNPTDRALGERPTTATREGLADAYLWIKYPGESDGSCNGGPAAGQWWGEYALGLARRANW